MYVYTFPCKPLLSILPSKINQPVKIPKNIPPLKQNKRILQQCQRILQQYLRHRKGRKKRVKKLRHNGPQVISTRCGFESGGCTRFSVKNIHDSNVQKFKAIKCNQSICSMLQKWTAGMHLFLQSQKSLTKLL